MGSINDDDRPGYSGEERRDGVKLLKGHLDREGHNSSGHARAIKTFDLREFHDSSTGEYGELPEYYKDNV